MKKRNTIMAGMTLGVSAAAIWAGVLVTSSAIASEPASDKANVTMLAPDPDGDGAISCEFAAVPTAILTATAFATLTGEGVGAEDSSGTVTASASAISSDGSGTITDSATAIPADRAPSP